MQYLPNIIVTACTFCTYIKGHQGYQLLCLTAAARAHTCFQCLSFAAKLFRAVSRASSQGILRIAAVILQEPNFAALCL
jgi:hypothetical protein